MTPNELAECLYKHWRKHESEPSYHYEWTGLGPGGRRSWLALADMVQKMVMGMEGERDAERLISQGWENKHDDLEDAHSALKIAYHEEVARVTRLQEKMRWIARSCEEDIGGGPDARAQCIAEAARKALLL